MVKVILTSLSLVTSGKISHSCRTLSPECNSTTYHCVVEGDQVQNLARKSWTRTSRPYFPLRTFQCVPGTSIFLVNTSWPWSSVLYAPSFRSACGTCPQPKEICDWLIPLQIIMECFIVLEQGILSLQRPSQIHAHLDVLRSTIGKPLLPQFGQTLRRGIHHFSLYDGIGMLFRQRTLYCF